MSRSPTSRDTDEDVDARLEIVDVAEAAPVPLHYFDDGSQSKKLADDDDNLVGGLENIRLPFIGVSTHFSMLVTLSLCP